MKKISFLEVDHEDRQAIMDAFPDADIVEGSIESSALTEHCRDSEAISCFINTVFDRAVLKKLPKLKLICTRSVGFDHIDVEACRSAGIIVCNVPDYGSHVIAEHVFALLLSTLRHIPEGGHRVLAGNFDYHGLRGMALRGKTIGIVGTGKIGRRVAQIAHGFGMKILAADQCRTTDIVEHLGVRYVEMQELLKQSDIITLHIPDTPETKHIINEKAFAQMKDGVILVNTARGSLIDSHALLLALKKGKVSHALLDVLEHEHNFEESRELVSHPNVVATPHVAFYADDSMKNMYIDTFHSIGQWLEGKEPEHAVHLWNVICDLPGISRT